MKNKSRRTLKLITLLIFAGLLLGGFTAGGAFANVKYFKAARAKFGKTVVKNCKYCHVKMLPKKDDHELNERGKWLLEQKKKRKAKDIDVSWLEEYNEKNQ